MKLKKFAAVAMAAVMSLAMFTACSGGGGSGSKPTATGTAWTEETVVVEKNGQKVSDGDTYYYTSDGTWTYHKFVGNGYTSELLYSKAQTYQVNTSSEPWKAYPEKPTESGTAPSYTVKDRIKEEGEGTYEGVTYKTYTVKTIYTDGKSSTSISYFDKNSNELKYSSYESRTGYKTMEKVITNTNTVDPANANKLNINNYILVEDVKDLGQ